MVKIFELSLLTVVLLSLAYREGYIKTKVVTNMLSCILIGLLMVFIISRQPIQASDSNITVEKVVLKEAEPVNIIKSDEEPLATELVYDSQFKLQVKKFLAGYSSLKATQASYTTVALGTTDDVQRITLDLNKDTMDYYLTTYIQTGSRITEKQYYINEPKLLFYEYDNNLKGWTNSSKVGTKIKFSLLEDITEGLNGVYSYLCEGVDIPLGTVGIIDVNNLMFYYECDAKVADLENTNYDSLGKKRVNMLFRKSGTYYIPQSIALSVGFIRDGINYESRVTTMFNSISNEHIVAPVIDNLEMPVGVTGDDIKMIGTPSEE